MMKRAISPGTFERLASTRQVTLILLGTIAACSVITAVSLTLTAARRGYIVVGSDTLPGLGSRQQWQKNKQKQNEAADDKPRPKELSLDYVKLLTPDNTIKKPCPEGCTKQGNCNHEEGRCECPFGYTGPLCNVPLFPACKLAYNATEMHTSQDVPRSCQCLRQARAFFCPGGARCETPRDAWYVPCWEHKRDLERMAKQQFSAAAQNPPLGVAAMVYSDVPERNAEDQVTWVRGIRADLQRTSLTRQQAVTIRGRFFGSPVPTWQVVEPVAHCPGSCNWRGQCIRPAADGSPPRCLCWKGYIGKQCEQVDIGACLNGCQGRGVCRRGFCHCKPGYWGKDCSRSVAYAPHSASSKLNTLKVYVYELPTELAFEFESTVGAGVDVLYSAYRSFYSSLLNDKEFRTENPWEANFFYVPALSYAYSSNTGDVVEHLTRVMTWVRSAHPFFNRTQGKDHFFWLANDQGGCWIPPEDPLLAAPAKIVHFGFHGWNSKLPGDYQVMPRKGQGCFNPLRDILAAPYFPNQATVANHTYSKFNASHIPTQRLAFFAGDIRPDQLDYSGGVRQELWALYNTGKLGADVTILDRVPPSPQYETLVGSSKYCLAPYGHGWGWRLSAYMALGCVPVIVQDSVYQPYEDTLPYHRFSIRLPKSRLPHLVSILRAIPDAQYLALRRNLAVYWPAFVWDTQQGGKAYLYTMFSLQLRLTSLLGQHY